MKYSFYSDVVVKEKIKDIREHEAKGINVSPLVLDLLEELGFDRNDRGTKYLEFVISELYHERKAFDDKHEFFDFNDENNNHYWFVNEYYEAGMKLIRKRIKASVKASYVNDKSMNEIVYGVTNDVISQVARDTKQLKFIKM